MQDLAADLNLERLAAETGHSRRHFLRMFQRATGSTPHRYLLLLRLKHAQELIRGGDLCLIDVAAACGFSSHAHMSRAFRMVLKLSPSEYRRSLSGEQNADDKREEKELQSDNSMLVKLESKQVNNKIVRQFFRNYLLIRERGFEAFVREQSKLFSPELLTIASDTRGTFSYDGIDGFFEGMVAWSKHFSVDGQSRHEYVDETPTHVFVRMHGDLRLLAPIDGATISRHDEHDWTQEFELSNDLITKVNVVLFFHQPQSKLTSTTDAAN